MLKTFIRLAIYQPGIPQNLGAMIRLCACFGVQIDLIEPCSFPFSLKAIRRTAMDYIDLVDIERHQNYDSFISKYISNRRVVLLTAKSSKNIWNFNFKSNDIIMVGNESSGVPDYVRDSIKSKVKIPIFSSARCLNVTIAASIAISEAIRQNNYSKS